MTICCVIVNVIIANENFNIFNHLKSYLILKLKKKTKQKKIFNFITGYRLNAC